MSENTSLMDKPKKLWNDALKMVKGEDTVQLMENFTSEMTLVAEGLCEDQNKLRGEVNQLMNEEDRRLQKLDARVEEMETLRAEQDREYDQVITERRNRLAVLEKQNERNTREREREKDRKEKKSRNMVRDITILIAVAAIAVIVVNLVLKYA